MDEMTDDDLTLENARCAAGFLAMYCHKMNSTESLFEFDDCEGAGGKSYQIIVRQK
jgi:hypothetical protein